MPNSLETSYQKEYYLRNQDAADRIRKVEVEATPQQIRHLEEEGYLVRERLITGELLERLRSAVDEIEAQERNRNPDHVNTSRRFGGFFLRNLLDRHPTFLEMLKYAPTLSVARAVLGPQVQVHAMVMRVTYPGQPNQETHWHFHQRVVPEPMPRFFTRPHVIDNLIYLDDIDRATGPLCVIPRSHLRDEDPPEDDYSDKPDQVALEVPEGTVVTAHASLLHRAMPTLAEGRRRRLIILGYSPTWMKPVDKTGLDLTKPLLKDGDTETRELLGAGGYF